MPPGAAAAVPSAFLATLPAAAATAWLVREQLTAWSAALGWPALAVEDVVFAVSEAVSNCTEHAYPPGAPNPVVEIRAVVEPAPAEHEQRSADRRDERAGQRLTIRVRDHGTWRPVPPDPGHRGRGLGMMVALMNDVAIHRGDTGRPGTEVVLVSPTVFPTPPTTPARTGRSDSPQPPRS